VWRLWPTEIESGLLPKADIYDWHRGTRDQYGALKLSSRRLLVLLEELPEASRYKTARRDGQWPEWMQILKGLHNETALHRASLYAGGENAYDATVFLDPLERRERFENSEAEEEDRQKDDEDFYADMGWS